MVMRKAKEMGQYDHSHGWDCARYANKGQVIFFFFSKTILLCRIDKTYYLIIPGEFSEPNCYSVWDERIFCLSISVSALLFKPG